MAAPETPKAPRPAPPPPTINDARIAMQENDTLRKRNGRSSTLLSTGLSRMQGGVATKMLLGQGG